MIPKTLFIIVFNKPCFYYRKLILYVRHELPTDHVLIYRAMLCHLHIAGTLEHVYSGERQTSEEVRITRTHRSLTDVHRYHHKVVYCGNWQAMLSVEFLFFQIMKVLCF